jgi:hypothetical protein
VGLVAALVAVFLLGAGSVVASAGASPTSPLYPVKRIVEQTRLLLATDAEQRALLHAEFARRRLDEAVPGHVATGVAEKPGASSGEQEAAQSRRARAG